MGRLWPAWLVAAALSLPAGAQDYAAPDGQPPPEPGQAEPAPSAPPEEPAPQGPVDTATARENYPAIVEAYVNQRAVNGVLPFKDKTKRVWKLELQSIDLKTFKRLRGTLFTACALMHEGPDKLDVDFTVDFSGDHWRVLSVNLHKVNGKARFEYRGGRRIAVP